MVRIKKIKTGAELEFFVIDEYGKLVGNADKFIRLLSKHLDPRLVSVQTEVGKSMVELNFEPTEDLEQLYSNVVSCIESVYDILGHQGAMPLIMGTYPAKAKYVMRRKSWYLAQKKLLGRNMERTLKVSGFHFHYTLPPRIVNKTTEHIEHLTYSESKDAFLNIYNFNIASDPALITLSQSSPYCDGEYIGKDSRVILYRDFSVDVGGKHISGIYSGIFSELGGLPNYEFTLRDINWSANNRKELYIQLLRKANSKIGDAVFKSPLAFMWGPIRVNKIGTLEYRGMDSSAPKYLFASASLMESVITKILKDGIRVLPSDIGIDEPFKLEGDLIYLPPFSYVKSIEVLSSIFGFSNTRVRKYVKSLLNLTRKLGVDNPFSGFVKDLLSSGKTSSDMILELVKKGGVDPNHPDDDTLEFVSLKYAEELRKTL